MLHCEEASQALALWQHYPFNAQVSEDLIDIATVYLIPKGAQQQRTIICDVRNKNNFISVIRGAFSFKEQFVRGFSQNFSKQEKLF